MTKPSHTLEQDLIRYSEEVGRLRTINKALLEAGKWAEEFMAAVVRHEGEATARVTLKKLRAAIAAAEGKQ